MRILFSNDDGIQAEGIRVTMITDTTPIAHNGCRPRKRRRV